MTLPGLRRWLGSPALSLTVVLTLAAGVALLTAVFGIVDAALWRQPPFVGAGRLAILFGQRSSPGSPLHNERWSFPRFHLLRQSATSFSSIANYSIATLTLTGSGDPEVVSAEIVGPEYFPLLEVTAARGRTFQPTEDDAPGAHPVVLISDQLWRRRFAADAGILGRSIGVSGMPLTVIGILPATFHGLTDRAELWIPTTMAPALSYSEYLTSNQDFVSAIARLKPGVSFTSATRELQVLGDRVNRALPPQDVDPAESFSGVAVPLNQARIDANSRRALLVLFAGTALLHLLAGANVVNLLLGRAASRRHVSALRAALGASTGRILGHQAAEGAILAVMGGALGVAVATWAARLLVIPANAWFARNFYGNIGTFDAPEAGVRPVLFGAALAAITALGVALLPATASLRLDVISGLRQDARTAAGGRNSLRHPSARGMVVISEAALAVLLLVAATLMVDSFARIRRASIGVQPDRVLTFWLRPSEVAVPPRDAPRFVSRVLDAIERVPGVVSASVDGGTPLGGSATSTLFIAGRPNPTRVDDAPPVDRHYVGPGHFQTLGIPLRRGRVFTPSDDAAHPRVAIISETAARRFWPHADPIGQRVWFGGGSSFDRPDSSAEIVGIVGDVAYEPLDLPPNRASFYTPYAQFTYASRAVFVRSAGDPLAMAGAIRQAVISVQPDLPLYDVQTLGDRIGASWARHRSDALLFTLFGIAALALAGFGIYAVVSYGVAQRTREMGIRLALGARVGTILGLVVREGLTFPIVGLLAGSLAALWSTRALRAVLYQVAPTDPRAFAVAILVLVGVSMLACLVPAIRATRVDPMEALRAE